MDHKLSMLVQVDLDSSYVRLTVTGCLTEANQHVLHPLIRRARALIPPVTVSVDLTAAGHLESVAVDLLRWAVDHDVTLDGASRALVLVPDDLPVHQHVRVSHTDALQTSGPAARTLPCDTMG